MSRKLIDNVPIHQLQYPEQGQNYVFNGCMKFLMECLGEDEQYDYWFFSTVSGDCYVQVYGTNKNKFQLCFSDAKFDTALIQRVFDAIGYNFTYIDASQWREDKAACKVKLIEYIDRGIPVIGKGFYHTLKESGEILPCEEISCVVGYENNGECFYRLPEEATDLIPFTLEDNFPYTFVFIEEKKETPPIAECYRKALLSAPELMKTPSLNGDVFFGIDAFEQWAKILEDSDFYRMTKKEWEGDIPFASWRFYQAYICIIATNIYSKQFTIDRALQMNPDLVHFSPLLDKEYKVLQNIENQLKEAEGYFNVTHEVLQDPEKCKKIASIMRQFPKVFSRIIEIIEGHK